MRGIFSTKYRVPRISTMTDTSGFMSPDEELARFTEDNEMKFAEYSMEESIIGGSHALLFWTLIVIVARTTTNLNRPDCEHSAGLGTREIVLSRILEYGFLLISCVPLFLCLKRPRPIMYLTVVCLHFIYGLAMNLPPYVPSCGELRDFVQCGGDPYRGSLWKHRDCTLQGHTSQQICMTWLLIMPRIIPRRWMMHLVWFWIFVFYFGTSWWYIGRDQQNQEFEKEDPELHQLFNSPHFTDVSILFSVILLCIVHAIAISKKFYLEKSLRNKYHNDATAREASEKMFDILHFMVPVHVIGRMLQHETVADEVDQVSILFIMICDFEQYTRTYSPDKLLKFLNEQFTHMDNLCKINEVTKIETVGEEYVAAVGVIPKDVEASNHGTILCRLIKVAADILKRQTPELKFKMGIHTGPVMAGVIGQKLPRFRLFGDTINTAARMMQKGLPGELQFGEETRRELYDTPVKYIARGPIEMKGKGKVEAFLLDQSSDMSRKSEKGKVTFEDAAASGPSASSSFSTLKNKRKSLVNTLITQSAQAETDVLTVEERRRRKISSGGSLQASAASMPAGMSASVQGQEVEMTAVQKESYDGYLRSPLLDEEDSPKRRPQDVSPRVYKKSGQSSLRPGKHPTMATTISTHVGSDESTETSMDVEKKKKFAEVLEEVERSQAGEQKKGWFSFGVDKQGFTPEMEKEWFLEYHKQAICKKLVMRLDKQALGLSIVTVIDTLFMIYKGDEVEARDEILYKARFRFPIFLASRSIAFMIIISWRVVSGSSDWVESHPKSAQGRLLASYLVIATLMFVSYDTLTMIGTADQIGEKLDYNQAKAIILQREYREQSEYSLISVPIYFIINSWFQLRFIPTCGFVVLAIALMALNYLKACGNLFFSYFGRILFILNSVMNAYLAHETEVTSRARFKAQKAMTNTSERIEAILNTLMPPLVVQEIRQMSSTSSAPPSHAYKKATIAQSDLCGFTKLASTRSPVQVVQFIGELFGAFDDLTNKHDIYKVETIGDAYIAGQADWPLTPKNKPISVVLFALDMVRETHKWSQGKEENVSCRVGVHTGECIGGIVGTEMQRYHLFGDLMSGLEILESTAPEGRVQVSISCKEACERQMREDSLPKEVLMFEGRSEAQLKTSKGEVHEYDEVGGPTFVVKSYAQLRSLLESKGAS